MLTRRGFIIAGGSVIGAAGLLGPAQAGAPTEALAHPHAASAAAVTVYSRSRQPKAQSATHDVVLSGDFTRSLATFEALLTGAQSGALILALDAADTVIFEIAQSRVHLPRPADVTFLA